MLSPGDMVRLRGSTQNWTVRTARYDEDKQMAYYMFKESGRKTETPGALITGVVTHL